MQITTVGLDLAKHVFQVHAIDAEGVVVLRKALRRAQVLPFFAKLAPCLIGLEACGTSHYWARELIRLGHEYCAPRQGRVGNRDPVAGEGSTTSRRQ